MPWIFLTLILANLAYFGWGVMQDSSTPRVKVAASQVIPPEKRLALLSERPDLAQATLAPAAPGQDSGGDEAQPVATGPLCFSVGPFANDGSPGRFVGRLQGKHFTTRVDVLKKDSTDFWVFVPALINREKAEEKLRELKRKGIDSFIVNDDPFTNAISLGHFSQQELAQSFKEKMVAEDVVAEMRRLPHTAEERWVYVSPGTSKADVKAMIDAALAGTTARKQPTPCEG
jgi:hypothetical protein